MAFRSRPTLKCGPRAAMTMARTARSCESSAHGERQVVPERRAHGVAGLGSVQPQRGDVAVAFDRKHLVIRAWATHYGPGGVFLFSSPRRSSGVSSEAEVVHAR